MAFAILLPVVQYGSSCLIGSYAGCSWWHEMKRGVELGKPTLQSMEPAMNLFHVT